MPITIRQFGCWFEPGKVTHLSVPIYHRSYSWEAENISDLLTVLDRVALDKNSKKSIHLGEIYFTSHLFSDEDVHALEIVDGAHRLITIALFFCAIRNCILESTKKSVANLDEVTKVDPTLSEITCFLTQN
jgi:uncharacterized protein with ParB-like and HNH nuclease domain